jgi:hypothetical protein
MNVANLWEVKRWLIGYLESSKTEFPDYLFRSGEPRDCKGPRASTLAWFS